MKLLPVLLLAASCSAQSVIDIQRMATIVVSGLPPMYTGIFGGGNASITWETCTPMISIPYTAFSTPAGTFSVPVVTVPDRFIPRVILVEETTTFASNSARTNALSLWLEGCAGCGWYYLAPFPLMRPAPNWDSSDAGARPYALASHTIYATVKITNANPGTLQDLTAGAIRIQVCGTRMLGASLPAPARMPSFAWESGKACVSTYSAAPFKPGDSPWSARCR